MSVHNLANAVSTALSILTHAQDAQDKRTFAFMQIKLICWTLCLSNEGGAVVCVDMNVYMHEEDGLIRETAAWAPP